MAKKLVHGIMRDLDAEERAYQKRQAEIQRCLPALLQAQLDLIIIRYELEPDEFFTAEQKAQQILDAS